jgi:hypothetical protein
MFLPRSKPEYLNFESTQDQPRTLCKTLQLSGIFYGSKTPFAFAGRTSVGSMEWKSYQDYPWN